MKSSYIAIRCVLDTLEAKLERISKKPDLILNEAFMTGIFVEYEKELPEFKDYLDTTYQKKQIALVARKSGSKVVHFARLRGMLFRPSRITIRRTRLRVLELGKTAADAILTELHDEKKATHKYLSCSNSEYCWKNCSDERKKALLDNTATMTRQRVHLEAQHIRYKNMDVST